MNQLSPRSLALLLFAVAPISVSAAATSTWNADLNHSAASFTATHLAISHVSGSIPIKSATIVTPAGSDIPVSVRAELDPKGVDTHVGMRDDDLRSPHFFDVGAYPKMSFESTKITATDDKHFAMVGNLTMHGATHSVSLSAQMIGKGPGPRGDMRIAYTATGSLDRTQWGMTYGTFVAGTTIEINLEIEAVKQ